MWVAVDRCRVDVRRVEALCASCDFEAGMYGAHPMGVRAAAVREGLAVVIVLLSSKTEQRKDDVEIRRGRRVVYPAP